MVVRVTNFFPSTAQKLLQRSRQENDAHIMHTHLIALYFWNCHRPILD